jgi:hypothetical protein
MAFMTRPWHKPMSPMAHEPISAGVAFIALFAGASATTAAAIEGQSCPLSSEWRLARQLRSERPMTLINIIRRCDRGIVVSDGAGLDDNARVATTATKVAAMPLIKIVVEIRGNYLISTLLMASLAADSRKFGSYEGLKAGLVDHLRAIFNRTIEGTPTPAWEIIDTGPLLLTPSDDAIFADIGKSLIDEKIPVDDQRLIHVAENQGRHVERYGLGQIRTSFVGGFLQRTEVTSRETTMRIIHQWPDRIGEPINVAPRKRIAA